MTYHWEANGKMLLPVLKVLVGFICVSACWLALVFLVMLVVAVAALIAGKVPSVELFAVVFSLCFFWMHVTGARILMEVGICVSLTDDTLECRAATRRLQVTLRSIAALRMRVTREPAWRKLHRRAQTNFTLEATDVDGQSKRIQLTLPTADFTEFRETLQQVYPALTVE